MRLSPRTVHEIDSPIGTAYALLDRRGKERELLDLAQAAPQYPTAPEVIEHIVSVARHPHGGDYVEIAGLPHLREAFAAELSGGYRGPVRPEQVVITAGCNQAFCLVASALADPGEEIVLTLPYYFNHDMWLRMNGITPVYLEPGRDLVPTPAAAEAVLTPRTRAIVLVTPGNPSGVTVEPDRIASLADVARRHDIALILDETYRSFRDTDEPPHALFTDPEWTRTLASARRGSDRRPPGPVSPRPGIGDTHAHGRSPTSDGTLLPRWRIGRAVSSCSPPAGSSAGYATRSPDAPPTTSSANSPSGTTRWSSPAPRSCPTTEVRSGSASATPTPPHSPTSLSASPPPASPGLSR